MKNKHGHGQNDRYSVGEVRIRIRKRYGRTIERAFVKVGEGKQWELRAHAIWRLTNGPIPHGLSIHHIDGNALNDALSNLALVSKARHLAIHRPEFADRALAAFIATRRRIRWSTKKKHTMPMTPPF